MNAQEAIEYLTTNEKSPSTLHLLALERLAQNPAWVDGENEHDEIVTTILADY